MFLDFQNAVHVFVSAGRRILNLLLLRKRFPRFYLGIEGDAQTCSKGQELPEVWSI